MATPFSDLHEEIHRELETWLGRLQQIDRLLEFSAPTLIKVANWAIEREHSVPLYISERTMPPARHYLLVHAKYSSTIQRLYRVHRRFSWLDPYTDTLRSLNDEMPKLLQASHTADRSSLEFLRYAASDLFGALNPVTSSEVFWAFIRAGERFAHSGVGFLAFFGMLWSLGRRYPDETEAGASLEPSGPSTTTTANCLIAIDVLCGVLRERGRLCREVAVVLQAMESTAGKRGPQATWRFTFDLDLLASKLFKLSIYSINAADFVAAGEALLSFSRPLRADSGTAEIWSAARDRLRRALLDHDAEQKEVLADAGTVVNELFPKIIERLQPGGAHDELRAYCHRLAESETDDYWRDHARAAARAQKLCSDSLTTLSAPFARFHELVGAAGPPVELLADLFTSMAESNQRVADEVQQAVGDNVRWCRRAINDESARGSAGNFTEFDPAGLIAAVSVAQKWDQISRPEAEDAIKHALKGAHPDGSWRRGQPLFLYERVMGVWPHTPDVVLMLAVAVNAEPAITIADEKIFAFVDWLERTKTHFFWRDGGMHVGGWSSELDRMTLIIDFWNTNVSINALLEIRELVETRLWQLCERRFTILHSSRRLSDIAPVDLGAVHEKRLHRRLMKMARWSELEDKYKDEDYALVLHGPPGSSKTAVIEGLGSEMWKELRHESHIVRITPADFIRQGEERVDFEARLIFELISHVRGVTILFDEIDDFLRQRVAGEEIRFLKLIVPAMLNRLQDLRDAAPRQEICFAIGTNFVDKIEPALLRPGRIDSIVPVSYPDAWSREAILDANVGEGTLSQEQIDHVIRETIAWPWSTFNRLTKVIGRRGEPVNDAVIAADIEHARDQVQSADQYYFDTARWQKPCTALANEFVHLAFSSSKDIRQCRGEVTKLINWLMERDIATAEHRIAEMFDRQVAVEDR